MRQPSIQKIFIRLVTGLILFFILISGLILNISTKEINAQSYTPYREQLTWESEKLVRLMEMEIPLLSLNVRDQESNKEKTKNSLLDLLLLTISNPNDWIKEEIPTFSFVKENGNKEIELPVESWPSDDFFIAEKSNQANTSQQEANDKSNQNTSAIPVSTGNKKVVFIYHTHNRESFLPELKTNDITKAFDPTINITLVGKQFSKELEKLGIGNTLSTKDYWPELEAYYLSYKYSLQTVQAALSSNKNLKYIFDIHRDANPNGGKELTTRKINGKNYATIFFVIGEGNKNYEENKGFAEKINAVLEEMYPGISRGIIKRQKTSGSNGEYNQSVSPNSLTIEIGGVNNTLQEEYQSAKALAEAFSEIYWEAVKVQAKPN